MEENIVNNNLNERDMLDQLLQVETNNRFYKNLHMQYQKYHRLTQPQIECLKKDYDKKLAHLVTSNMDRVETKKSETDNIIDTTNPAKSDNKSNSNDDTCRTWKNGVVPATETIEHQHSIEEFLGNYLESPDYGTRESITDIETIKTIIGLIKDRMVMDRSHYHGYDPHTEAKYQKTTLTFKQNTLLKNGVALDCGLNDPMFDGMRINNCRDSIQILLDFYHPEEGYSLKCVNFDVRGVIKQENKKDILNKENISKSDEETIEPTQKTNTIYSGNTPGQTTLSTKENVASATHNNTSSGDVIVDHRKRTSAQLETVFGKLNKFKLMCLYNDSKISLAEYEDAVKHLEENKKGGGI